MFWYGGINMDIKKMPLEKLELLSYADIAYELLKASKRPKTTPKLFKEVCKLLKISEDQMMEMIGDFYTTLTTDQRFLLLDNAEWDLKDKHAVKTVVVEEDEEEDEAEEEPEEQEEETEDEAVTGNEENYDDDEEEDDLSDLAILTEEELEEE